MTDDIVEPDPISFGETTAPQEADSPAPSAIPGDLPAPPAPPSLRTGWHSDPSARHELRYFASGQPTDLVRDDSTDGIDADGEQLLKPDAPFFDSAPVPETSSAETVKRNKGRVFAVVGVAITLVIVAGAASILLLGGGPGKDSTYLSQLKTAGLAGQFPSDANAIANAKLVCTNLEAGGKQQGLQVDEIGVGVYCDKFAQGFHVLEVAEIKGTFSLIDTSPSTYYPAITSSGVGCSGSGGYSDIHSGTQVFLKNGKGDVLANGSLSSGVGGTRFCTFSFTMPITEGEDTYIVEVGKRGQLSYSFTELKNDGLALSLGD